MHLVGFSRGRCSSPGKQPSGSGVAELNEAGPRLVQAFTPILAKVWKFRALLACFGVPAGGPSEGQNPIFKAYFEAGSRLPGGITSKTGHYFRSQRRNPRKPRKACPATGSRLGQWAVWDA